MLYSASLNSSRASKVWKHYLRRSDDLMALTRINRNSELCVTITCDWSWKLLKSEGIYEGGPLFLSPYIVEGKILEARRDSRVNINKILANPYNTEYIESYSGYLTVNSTYNSNLFFWFFPAQEKQDAPLVLYLRGSAAASTPEVFLNGPLKFNDAGEVYLQEDSHSWTRTQSIIYLDSPVGSGFSFTEDPKGYSRNDQDIAENIYVALVQFLQIFYEYKSLPFYIAGLYDGGKYATALAFKIDQENKAGVSTVNLKGLLLLSPLLDPVIQSYLADVHYNFGLYDEKTRDELKYLEKVFAELIKTNDIPRAAKLADDTYGINFNTSSIFNQKTGYESIYDGLLHPEIPPGRVAPRTFIQQNEIRHEIHAGNLTFSSNSPPVVLALLVDLCVSVSERLAYLLASGQYKIWILNGQFDLLIPPSSIDAVLKNLVWAGYNDFFNAEQVIWRSEGEVAGYVKKFGYFSHVIIRLAGHIIYFDAPKWTAEILGEFLQ
ncbi:unnamed protein product [Allacma fusca]|uniref:Uncharacterized protein n=1 Tax=Allacma fusca TaxID=39272 RepID=A0A8J2KBV7_9HEXA|nr:unnamed protein product [Allacma fusca]